MTAAAGSVLDGLWAHGNDYTPVERSFQARTGQALRGPLTCPDDTSEAVSVVVASYNGGRSLFATLAALQRQRYRNLEVVVVDDGSTTPLEPVVRSAALTVPVTLIRSSVNRGASTARNVGLHCASGSTVIFLDDDMLAPPEMVGALALRQQHTEGCLFLGFRENTKAEVFFDTGAARPRIERDWRYRSDRGAGRQIMLTADEDAPDCNRTVIEPLHESEYFKRFGHCRTIGFWDLPGMVAGHSVCVKRADAISAGGFSEEYFSGWGAEDLAFGALMAAHGYFIVPALDWVCFHLRHEGRHMSRAEELLNLRRNFARYRSYLTEPLAAARFPSHRLHRCADGGGLTVYELQP
jgi:glycosyltransferase involved in cell wall biosynthesis